MSDLKGLEWLRDEAVETPAEEAAEAELTPEAHAAHEAAEHGIQLGGQSAAEAENQSGNDPAQTGFASQMRPQLEALEKDLSGYKEFAEPYGGLDGVRQFQPVLEAFYEPDPAARVEKTLTALQAFFPETDMQAIRAGLVNDPNFLNQFAEQNEQALLDYYAQSKGDVLREKLGVAPPPTVVDEEDFYEEPEPASAQAGAQAGVQMGTNPEVEALKQEIAALRQQLGGNVDPQQQLAQQVGGDVFGQVVENVMTPLEAGGWAEKDLAQAFNIAQTMFEQDPQAVNAYKLATQFAGKPVYGGHAARARDMFSNHLATAIKMVDAVRGQQAANAQPKPLGRQEIATQQPDMNTGAGDFSFFDNPDAFMKGAMQRAQAQGRVR